jgi:hypothetical protein
MLAHAGLSVEGSAVGPESQTEAAIRADSRLSETNKQALLSVYRSLIQPS